VEELEETAMKHLENEIVEMKSNIKVLEKEVDSLKEKAIRHDEQISSINRTLDSINENTMWIKRKITGAFITAVITGVVGGAIAIFYAVLQK
jgi:chromosome segregation ATPase